MPFACVIRPLLLIAAAQVLPCWLEICLWLASSLLLRQSWLRGVGGLLQIAA